MNVDIKYICKYHEPIWLVDVSPADDIRLIDMKYWNETFPVKSRGIASSSFSLLLEFLVIHILFPLVLQNRVSKTSFELSLLNHKSPFLELFTNCITKNFWKKPTNKLLSQVLLLCSVLKHQNALKIVAHWQCFLSALG